MPDMLSQTFAALADPTRRAMLVRLSRGEANVSELAGPFLKEMSLPAVTKHVKVLEKVGLITKTRDAQYRPCKLNGAALKVAADWMEQYRVYWEESFDRLDAYLKTVTAKTAAAQASDKTAIDKTVPRTVEKSAQHTAKPKVKGKRNGRRKHKNRK